MTVEALGRAVGLYRRTATSRSAIALVVANAIPLVGVLFFGWSLLTILVIFWIENGIVGFWNFFKINFAQGSIIPQLPEMPEAAALAATRNRTQAAALRTTWDQARRQRAAMAAQATSLSTNRGFASAGRFALSAFFVIHYGGFWLVHGIFVFALPSFGNGLGSDSCDGSLASGLPFGECAGPFGDVVWSNVLLAAAGLFISHGASFLFNYIGRGEYLTASPAGQMAGVYGRVVVLHLTIIFGAFVVAFLGAPIGALLILVVLKTGFDLGLHLRERRKADARIPAGTAYAQAITEDPT